MENKYGFAVLGGGKEGNTQKSPGSQGLPLLPPEGDVARKKRPVDYIVCVLVVIFMVASAQISSILQVKYHFNNPAFIIWFSTSWLILCFPLQIIYYYNILKRKGSIVEILGGKIQYYNFIHHC
jgi:hypothetical protein